MSDNGMDVIYRAAHVTPSARQLRWMEYGLTAFIHFTVNTFTDREWGDGGESQSVFDPSACDPRQWASVLSECGFRMAILTAKHHDGFCLWPSSYTDHSIRNSPYRGGKGDLVREFVDACREFGIRPGIYLSPWDRHEASYGDSPRYNEYFKNQLRELCSNYGEIACFWFDGACAEGSNGKKQEYDWEGYWSLIRELQPEALISDIGPDARWCGNEAGKGRAAEWSVINLDKSVIAFNHENCTKEDVGSREKLGDGRNLCWYPSEVDTSIRPGWFHHASEDDEVKSLAKLVDIYVNSVGGNAVLLLNIPPDRRGLFHENDVARLRELRAYLDSAFSCDLAKGATVTASAWIPGYEAAKAIDGKADSCWRTPDGDERAELTLSLPEVRRFNAVVLREQVRIGQRIERFAVDVMDAAGNWVECAVGETVGFRKIVRFSAVESRALRIRIAASRLCPTLSELGVYMMPELKEMSGGVQSLPSRAKWRVLSVSSESTGYEAAAMIAGGDAEGWRSRPEGMPQEFVVDMGMCRELDGFTCLPPAGPDGHILNYELYCGCELDTMALVCAGEFSNTVNNPIEQKIRFTGMVKGRYIRLRALSVCGGGDFAALRDFNIILGE